MSVIIEFCQSNLAQGNNRVKDQLMMDAEKDMEVLDYDCLGNCSECFLFPFSLVNGERVDGETPEDLLQKIRVEIKRKIAEAEQWRNLGF